MHYHADGAVVRVGRYGMNVGDLDERKECQQQQTDKRGRTHSPWLALPCSSRLSDGWHKITVLFKEYTGFTGRGN